MSITNAYFKLLTLKNAKPVFKNSIDFTVKKGQNWLVLGPAKTSFLSVLSGKYIANPPLSRVISNRTTFLSFNDNLGISKEHLSARYESFSSADSINNSVADFIWGTYNYNLNQSSLDVNYVQSLIKLFRLDSLLNNWVNTLSNGQTRRLKLVKSLVQKPELLVIDDPFLGLDVDSTKLIWKVLSQLSKDHDITLVLGLRANDINDDPNFEKDVAFVDSNGLSIIPRSSIEVKHERTLEFKEISEELTGEPHIEFSNACIKYGDKVVIENFNWSIPKGSTWRILGNNGTGKTTLLSIITCDHPQSWKSIISINGKLRKAGSGQTFFKINNEIGISSPELHTLVPPEKTMKEVILNGLIPNIGNSNFSLSYRTDPPEFALKILQEFDDVLSIHSNTNFKELPVTLQKLALFLRAVIKNPEIVILDEAFSCFDDEKLLRRCHDVLPRYLANSTKLIIGHIDWELPQYDFAMKLNEDKSRSIMKAESSTSA